MSKKNLLLKTAIGATVGTVGLSYVIYREVIEKDAKIIKFISDNMDKKNNQGGELDPREAWLIQQHLYKFVMKNEEGYDLKAYLLKAEEPTNKYVLLSHGYRSQAKNEFKLMAKHWHDKGVNVFMVDHVASGESEGKYIGFGYFEHRDCMRWIDFMIRQFGSDIQIALHGVSMGSATVMLMSGDEKLPENVKFTVADCGFTTAIDEFNYCLSLAHIPSFPLVPLVRFITQKKAGYDLRDTNCLYAVTHAKVPMLFIHGGADDFVPTFMGKRLYDACRTEKDLLIVDAAWHAESYPTFSKAYEEKVDEFIGKYFR